jgi:hypothetical protein
MIKPNQSVQVILKDIATLSQWAPLRERLELSGIFLAAMGLGEAVLAHRGIPVSGGLLHAIVSATVCTMLWGTVPTGFLVFIRWLAMFLLWSVEANSFAIHMSVIVDAVSPIYEVTAP